MRKRVIRPVLICQCGCGETIPTQDHHSYSPPKYLNAHKHRSPAFKAEYASRRKTPVVIRAGLCECGCGGKTAIAKFSCASRGIFIGMPKRFLVGHQTRTRRGGTHPNWKRGRHKDTRSYWVVNIPGHRLAQKNGNVLEHRLVWEETH